MMSALMHMRSTFVSAAVLALLLAAPASAGRPETPPPGMAKYMMVLWEPGTPLPGNSGKLARPELPDVARLGGRVLSSRQNRHVIYLPKGQANGLRRHAGVLYLQRIWTGESFDDWDETSLPENDSRARIAPDSDPDLNWGPVNYTYDGSGNVKTAGSDAYIYDSAGRLIQATVGGKTETYKYDSFGNLTEKAVAGSAPVSIPVDGGSNRMIGPEYDAAGNVVRTPDGKSYSYDSVGMMAAVDHFTPRRNIYDADDERIGRIFDPTKSRWSIRDLEGRVLREFVSDFPGEPWTWEQDQVYADGVLVGGETQEWGYLDSTVYLFGGRRHYHLDHLGSVRMVTDDSSRAVALRDYYPFGTEQTASWQEPIVGHNFIDDARFTGHERDFLGLLNVEGSNYLDYMHARHYDPNKGRFLSVDPVLDIKNALKMPQMWNRYSYVLNNPTRFTDPTGKYVCQGSKIDCKIIDAAIAGMKTAAAGLPEGSKERVRIEKAIALYGNPGEKNGVYIRSDLTRLVPAATKTGGLVTLVRLNLEFAIFSASSGKKGSTYAAEIAGIMGHEASHGVTQRLTGGSRTGAQNRASEWEAFYTQAAVHQGLGISSSRGIWTREGGLDENAIQDWVEIANREFCSSEGANCQ